MYILCLPKIDINTTKNQIFNIFDQYKFGLIKKIDLISISQSKRAFIHYEKWDTSEKNNLNVNIHQYLLYTPLKIFTLENRNNLSSVRNSIMKLS